jgi:hypothetical protein
MTDLKETFNKTQDLVEATIRRDLETLDQDKLELFMSVRAGADQSEADRQKQMDRERPQRVAAAATRLAAQRTLEPGTTITQPPFLKAEVTAYYDRAKSEGVSVEQLKPQNTRERYIQIGISQVQKYEKDQEQVHAAQRQQNERKLLDNLLSIDDGRPPNGPNDGNKKDDGNKR